MWTCCRVIWVIFGKQCFKYVLASHLLLKTQFNFNKDLFIKYSTKKGWFTEIYVYFALYFLFNRMHTCKILICTIHPVQKWFELFTMPLSHVSTNKCAQIIHAHMHCDKCRVYNKHFIHFYVHSFKMWSAKSRVKYLGIFPVKYVTINHNRV